jgi:hypothetical protein
MKNKYDMQFKKIGGGGATVWERDTEVSVIRAHNVIRGWQCYYDLD